MMPTFLGKKTQMEPPYAVFTADSRDGEWRWEVLKAYANDNAAEYARWMCRVSSPYTFGSADMGDTYVEEVVGYGTLVEVNGEPATSEDQAEMEHLRVNIQARKLAARL